MRIAAQNLVVLNPNRGTLSRAASPRPNSTSATPQALRTLYRATGASPAANPFANLFQNLSQPPATASSAAAAPVTLPTAADSSASTSGTAAGSTTTPKPGIAALVSAIMNGSFKASNVTDPAKLKEVTPWMTDTMPSFYYASDDTAAQMAQLLGGSVVQMPAFGQNPGWSEPKANFIALPNGQTFNVADVAYYARCGGQGTAQLTADLTMTINQGSAWSNYYKNGGAMPSFSTGYAGPPISGMDYPAGTVGADGMVINPAMVATKTAT